jgi:hypothetical protein
LIFQKALLLPFFGPFLFSWNVFFDKSNTHPLLLTVYRSWESSWILIMTFQLPAKNWQNSVHQVKKNVQFFWWILFIRIAPLPYPRLFFAVLGISPLETENCLSINHIGFHKISKDHLNSNYLLHCSSISFLSWQLLFIFPICTVREHLCTCYCRNRSCCRWYRSWTNKYCTVGALSITWAKALTF